MTAPNWELAACQDIDSSVFYPEGQGGASVEPAKRICRSCPIQPECLKWALETREPHGVWGGKSETARRKMQPGIPAARVGGGPSKPPGPRASTVEAAA